MCCHFSIWAGQHVRDHFLVLGAAWTSTTRLPVAKGFLVPFGCSAFWNRCVEIFKWGFEKGIPTASIAFAILSSRIWAHAWICTSSFLQNALPILVQSSWQFIWYLKPMCCHLYLKMRFQEAGAEMTREQNMVSESVPYKAYQAIWCTPLITIKKMLE